MAREIKTFKPGGFPRNRQIATAIAAEFGFEPGNGVLVSTFTTDEVPTDNYDGAPLDLDRADYALPWVLMRDMKDGRVAIYRHEAGFTDFRASFGPGNVPFTQVQSAVLLVGVWRRPR